MFKQKLVFILQPSTIQKSFIRLSDCDSIPSSIVYIHGKYFIHLKTKLFYQMIALDHLIISKLTCIQENHVSCIIASVNGNWAAWSSWSKCGVSCGTGLKYRTRTCTNPAPSNGGIGCSSALGGKQQTSLCLMPLCPGRVYNRSCLLVYM